MTHTPPAHNPHTPPAHTPPAHTPHTRHTPPATSTITIPVDESHIPAAPSLTTPTPRTQSQQRLDPLGALTTWPMVPGIATVVLGYAVFTTVAQGDEIRHPWLAALALVLIAAACATLVVVGLPSRSPVRQKALLLIVGLGLAAHLVDQAARWGGNALVQDDFGPIGVGLLLVALAPLRPWRELALSGVLAAVVIGAVTLPQSAARVIEVSPAVYVIVAVTQVLALALAAAAYSRRMVRLLVAWQTDAQRAIARRTEESRGSVVRSVMEQQLATLTPGVFPLFDGVLERGEVTKADVARANELAAGVRRALVAHIDETWLDAVIARERAALASRGVDPLLVVSDPEHRAAHFGVQQRAATSALIRMLCLAPGFDPRSLVVQADTEPESEPDTQIDPTSDRQQRHSGIDTFIIQVGLDLPPRRVRRLLRSYLAVLRVVFPWVRVSIRRPRLTLEFGDKRPPRAPSTLG
ncbi:hypothetical protein [Cryobacterium cryoconiti]|uniref:Uncharacterized protein n=1 Tax=Cryobacterium cryoconiti TaxID=1259239 RepID=A0A4Y8JX26_9MICO|nr:hypothetical protein [Cryobacterium cryoconiti]TFD28017.1 hypothetical protein E3T49_12425 [Cryobacterium cryoconiti]